MTIEICACGAWTIDVDDELRGYGRRAVMELADAMVATAELVDGVASRELRELAAPFRSDGV